MRDRHGAPLRDYLTALGDVVKRTRALRAIERAPASSRGRLFGKGFDRRMKRALKRRG